MMPSQLSQVRLLTRGAPCTRAGSTPHAIGWPVLVRGALHKFTQPQQPASTTTTTPALNGGDAIAIRKKKEVPLPRLHTLSKADFKRRRARLRSLV